MGERQMTRGSRLDRSLSRALANAGVSVLYQDPDLRILWSQNAPGFWTSGDISGKTDRDFLPIAEAERLIALKQDVLHSARPTSLEINVPDGEGTRWFQVWMDADRDEDGVVRGIITTVVETTDQKRREQTLKALLREVSHRSKNLLAIIQSIATQTGRFSGTIDTFLKRFYGRLQSLAFSQDLVTSSNWRGADLHELVMAQTGRYFTEPDRSIHLVGENPYLNPNAALHIGLAIHELAVNSISYGALSQPNGAVTISAEVTPGDDDNAALTLVWEEQIPSSSDGEREKRFGSVALERVVPVSLNGSAALVFSSDRLEYRLLVPAGSFEID